MKFFILFFWVLCLSCQESLKIIDKPIVFNEERNNLTLQYLDKHYNLKQERPTITPKIIVLHWTAISTLEKSFKAFEKTTLFNTRPDIKNAGNLNVSTHFLVDQDGTIYRLMNETTMARHVIGLNHCAIGIENVGGVALPLTPAQLASNIWLVEYLKNKYEIDYLIGHYEYINFVDHELWLEKDANYRTKKTDPGKYFLEKVKKATKNLNFKLTPEKNSIYEN